MTSPLIQSKIAAVRRRHLAIATATGAGWVVTAFLGILALSAALDWWLKLPIAPRGVLLGANLSFASYLVWRLIIRPIANTPNDDSVALWIERRQPAFSSRLISAVQLSRSAPTAVASPGLVAALVYETEQLASKVDSRAIVDTTKLTESAGVCAAVVVAWLIALSAASGAATALLKRALLIPYVAPPFKTQIDQATGDLLVARGESVTLSANARGIIPSAGTVLLRYDSGAKQELTVEKSDADPHRFERTLTGMQESFTYQIRLNDNQTPPHRVKVITPPAIASIQFEQIFPQYTGLAPMKRSPSDLRLLVGSQLKLTARATKPLNPTGNQIRFIGSDKTVPLQPDPRDHSLLQPLTFSIAPQATGLCIDLTDEQSMTSRNSPVYRIDWLPDNAPSVRVNIPREKEELITAAATILIAFDAADDIALGQLSLHYKTKSPKATEPSDEIVVPLDVSSHPRTLRAQYHFKPAASAPLALDTTLEWWLEARDTNNVTGPGVATSEHYLARVVTPEQKRAQLLAKMNDHFRELDDVATNQTKLNSDLGQVITEAPPPK